MEREKFNYFLEETNKRLDKIDEKLERLISFRVLLIGMSMAVSALITVAINIALVYATGK